MDEYDIEKSTDLKTEENTSHWMNSAKKQKMVFWVGVNFLITGGCIIHIMVNYII